MYSFRLLLWKVCNPLKMITFFEESIITVIQTLAGLQWCHASVDLLEDPPAVSGLQNRHSRILKSQLKHEMVFGQKHHTPHPIWIWAEWKMSHHTVVLYTTHSTAHTQQLHSCMCLQCMRALHAYLQLEKNVELWYILPDPVPHLQADRTYVIW